MVMRPKQKLVMRQNNLMKQIFLITRMNQMTIVMIYLMIHLTTSDQFQITIEPCILVHIVYGRHVFGMVSSESMVLSGLQVVFQYGLQVLFFVGLICKVMGYKLLVCYCEQDEGSVWIMSANGFWFVCKWIFYVFLVWYLL